MKLGFRNSLSRKTLRKSAKENPEGLVRLAKFLKLTITGMSLRQVADLIRWRITRKDMIGESSFKR